MISLIPGPRLVQRRSPTWLVTGGAGYIGSHVVRALRDRGLGTVVVDDLSTGRWSRVVGPALIGRVQDRDLLAQAFEAYRPVGVIHLAASKSVAESVADPRKYYDNNVTALLGLLEAMRAASVTRMVFSSSAAVYGETGAAPVTETDPTEPVSAYGRSKLVGEWMLADYARAHGLRYVALRYFNVAGSGSPVLNDEGAPNLIPQVLAAVSRGVEPVIFGVDYDTPDGTCVRDFIDVRDLADAHSAVLGLLDAPEAAHVFNVGIGQGYSVREVVDCALAASGSAVRPVVLPGRPGDAVSVIADSGALRLHTGWQPEHDLRDMIASSMPQVRVLPADRSGLPA